MGKSGRHKLPAEVTSKLWAKHWFRTGSRFVVYREWCERQAQHINETSDSRMAYVEYTQEGTEGVKCQVMDANPPEPRRANHIQTCKAVNDF